MNKGIFISIEGPDGSGKSTQIDNIKRYFEKAGFDIVFTREPGGTEIGESIRTLLLDSRYSEMCSMTETMLYAASRAQHVEQVIKPAIEAGKIVICDRFVDSSIAYQGYGRNLGKAVNVINEYAISGCMPDVTFLLKVDPEVGRHRIDDGRNKRDRLESEKEDFHSAVFEGYLKIERENPNRIVGIDASRSIESIRDEIYARLDEILEKKGFES